MEDKATTIENNEGKHGGQETNAYYEETNTQQHSKYSKMERLSRGDSNSISGTDQSLESLFQNLVMAGCCSYTDAYYYVVQRSCTTTKWPISAYYFKKQL